MNLNGTFTINAPARDVWSVFMDAEKLGGCVPGVETIRVESPTRYEAEMTVKVQFMTIRFRATGELKEAKEGESLKVELVGQPLALAGLFRNRLQVELEEASPGETQVRYAMDLQMTGRLASLGAILIKGTVVQSAEQFAENVKRLFNERTNEGDRHASG